MSWNKGPLPPDTWDWGGVVPTDQFAGGFYFADFCGDYVVIIPGGRVLKPDEVAYYNNSLELPPGPKRRKSGKRLG